MFTTKNLLKLIGRNTLISLVVVSIAIVSIHFLKKETEKITNSVVLNHKLESDLKKRNELFSVIKKNTQIIGNNNILINNAFIPSDNVSDFINALDKVAFNNGVTQKYHFETPTPSIVSDSFPLSTIPYSNNLVTDVKTFSNYLKDIENLPYFTKVESINILSQDPTGWLGLSTISLRASLITKTAQ